VTVSALAALLLASAAAADIGIVRAAPSVARTGQLVTVRVNGYLPLRSASMPIVLVRADRLPRPYPCDGGTAICEPRVWRGRLVRSPYRIVGFARRWIRSAVMPDHANALVRFRVPGVRSGRYRLALWCGPCVRGPQGSLIGGPALVVR